MRHPSTLVALSATTCFAALCPVAGAATITVDDDRVDCPAAPVTSVQRAVDLAAPGDTIVVCPGDYVEGKGTQGSNAITSTKALSIRGAGADLVRIRPKALQPSGSAIAKATPDVAAGTGSILVARAPLQLSGVSIDGAGVVAEAGIVLIDAPGSTLRRIRVTNLTTSEAGSASTLPGGYRSGNPGWGVAVLGATAPGTTTIALSRIDRYNAAGIVVDGAGNQVTVSVAQVIGRSVCQDVAATGDCDPLRPLRDGPLYGQDGVRATGGGVVAVSGSIVSQNQVAGTNAPEPGTATNNANLVLGAGLRVGAGAASSVTRSNVVDNAYGMINSGTAQAFAEQNWWGLRYPTGPGGAGGTPPPVNTGPAISPTTNPPIPENPVNGTAVPDGAGITSSLVDVFPFRDGQQGDPSRGQYPIVDVPGPQPDAGPTLSLAAAPASVAVGATTTLTAQAADDVGVTRVAFFDGAAQIGADAEPPYRASYTPPAGTPCAPRELTAIAEDSSGQTTGASTTVLITGCPVPPGGGGPGTPALPTIALAAPSTIDAGGAEVAFATTTPAGLRSVALLMGSRTICRITGAPLRCRYLPLGAEVGRQVLRAVVTDALGRTAEATQSVTVSRFAVRRISVGAKRSGRTVALRIRLVVPVRSRVSPRSCPGASVTLLVRRDGRSLRNARLTLDRTCTAKARVTGPPGAYTARVGFAGSKILRPATTTKRFR